jgi:hypothetical protein
LALEYTGDAAYAYYEASQKFRLPYWDWANDPTLPPSSKQENVTINGPNGELILHNPLYNYRWPTYPLNETQFPGKGGQGPVTTRGGDNGFDPDFVDNTLLQNMNIIKDSVVSTKIEAEIRKDPSWYTETVASTALLLPPRHMIRWHRWLASDPTLNHLIIRSTIRWEGLFRIWI